MEYKLTLPDNYIKPYLPGRDELTAALRSGRFAQTTGCLKNLRGYCCLGVICELQGRLIQSPDTCSWCDGAKNTVAYLDVSNPLYPILMSSGKFPHDVLVGVEAIGRRFTNLADCNDNEFNFNQIADIIEAVWDSQ